MSNTYHTLQVETRQDIVIISLNRPEKKNAMSFNMMAELMDVAKKLKNNRHIRAVILIGVGGNFSSGLDLADLNSPKRIAWVAKELIKPTPSLFQSVCLIWQDLPMPVIAVIEGVCLGAGLQLALGADMRIAAPDSRLGLLESKWGLVADMGITKTARHISTDKLKWLMMSAQMIDAKEAQRIGLVSSVSDDAMAAAMRIISQMNERSPDAILAAKRVSQRMSARRYVDLYHEKLWQMRLLMGKNRKIALKKVKDSSAQFLARQFK